MQNRSSPSSTGIVSPNKTRKSFYIGGDSKVSKRRDTTFPDSSITKIEASRRRTVIGSSTAFPPFKPRIDTKEVNANETPRNDQSTLKQDVSPRRTSIFKNPNLQHQWQTVSTP